MATFTFNGVVFDTSANPAAIVHGYDRAARTALTGDTLIKVRDSAVKTNLSLKLTKGLQVTTYDPKDLKDPSNFFNFVSSWEAILLSMETHFKTYFMDSVFNVIRRDDIEPSEADIQAHEFALNAFLAASLANGGDAQSYEAADANNNVITHHRPAPPTGTFTLEAHGDLLRAWHTMNLQDVIDHVELMIRYVDSAVDRQNLSWSFQYLMDCLDADLQAFVLSKISHMNANVGRSGPVVFMIVAQRMLQTTENLAQKVINGFIALRLTHFDSESVVEAIFTIRNVLKFLRYGEANTFAPRTSIVLLYDVFRGSSVGAFRAYVQQAQDIVLKDETDPEIIFNHLQSKYEELLLADRWVPMKKKASAFALGEPQTKTCVEADKIRGNGNGDDDKKRRTHDKSGKKIDYTPPKNGESHTRTVDGVTEYWCGICGRWGNHKTAKHDEWRDNFKNRRNRNRNNGNNGNGNGNRNNNGNGTRNNDANRDRNGTATPPGANTANQRPRGAVTFISALTGNTRFCVDSELADGISFDE